jgi:hypothetical protein
VVVGVTNGVHSDHTDAQEGEQQKPKRSGSPVEHALTSYHLAGIPQ